MTSASGLLGALALALVSSLVLVGLVRRYALQRAILDHPNERSSHSAPTPRGGGLGIVASVTVVALGTGVLGGDVRMGLCLAAFVSMSAVGWLDDRRGLGVRVRFLAQLVAALAVAVLSLDSDRALLPTLGIFAWWLFWTVSSTNVLNFMDGIDGLVASQAMIFNLSLGALALRLDGPPLLPLVLACACAGFLPWNFPRARIFLGDAGSCALGFAVAWVGLVGMREMQLDVVRANLPLVPLFADAAVTMFRRHCAGERITQAHRQHLYQRTANAGVGHIRVTVGYAVLAAAGGLVAQSAAPADAPLLYCLYLLLVAVVGWRVDARFPFRTPKLT